jgi:chromosome partitioning protein
LIRDCLGELKKDYNYILIDCMPSLSMLTTNALTMANEVIIPVQSQYLSAKGMGNLLKTISIVKRKLNNDLKVGGILLTLVDKRTNLPRAIQQELEENYGSIVKLYDTQIPVAIKTAESTSKGKSIFAYDKNSKVAEAYSFFAKEVLKEDERERRKNALAKGFDR